MGMKMRFNFAMAICAVLGLAGCFSLDTAVLDSRTEHVVVRNYGWYLFNCIPLLCGNAAPDGGLPFVCFRDDVTQEKIQRRFMDYAAPKGVDASELNYFNDESVMLEIPAMSLSIPVPYLICYREVQLSGVLKPKRTSAGKEAAGK